MSAANANGRQDELHEALEDCMNGLWGAQAALGALLADRRIQQTESGDLYALVNLAKFRVDAAVEKNAGIL